MPHAYTTRASSSGTATVRASVVMAVARNVVNAPAYPTPRNTPAAATSVHAMPLAYGRKKWRPRASLPRRRNASTPLATASITSATLAINRTPKDAQSTPA